MPEMAKHRMDDWDWKLLGRPAEQKGVMNRRLDVPVPETASGLYELSNRLGALSQELARTARITDDAPTAIRNALFLLGSWRNQLKDLQREWDTIIQERERDTPETRERTVTLNGTAVTAGQPDLQDRVDGGN